MEDILTQTCHRLQRHDETLTLLNLSCRGVGSEGVTKMVDACRRRRRHIGDHCYANARVSTVELPTGHHASSVSKTASSGTTSFPPTPSSSLVALWLEGNEIYSSGAKALRRLLAVSPRIKYLYLSNNHIGDAGINALAPMALCQLEVCHLGDNDIGPLGALALAETLSGGKIKNSTVAMAAGDSMISHTTTRVATPAVSAPITVLHVEDVVTLHAKPAIKTLILDNNRLGDDGAKVLANALRHNTTLKHLDIRYNKIGMDALCTFRDVLKNKENTTLEHLCFEEIDDKALLDGVTCIRRPPRRRNRTLSRVMEQRTCPCVKCDLRYEIDFYLALNRSGRRGFGDVTVPVGCWPRILARVTDEPCLLFTVLTIRPDVPTEGRCPSYARAATVT